MRLRFFLSSQLDYMVTGGTVHIALVTATAAAAMTAMSQMNGFHTHSLRQNSNKIKFKKNAVAVVRCERTFSCHDFVQSKKPVHLLNINISVFRPNIIHQCNTEHLQ